MCFFDDLINVYSLIRISLYYISFLSFVFFFFSFSFFFICSYELQHDNFVQMRNEQYKRLYCLEKTKSKCKAKFDNVSFTSISITLHAPTYNRTNNVAMIEDGGSPPTKSFILLLYFNFSECFTTDGVLERKDSLDMNNWFKVIFGINNLKCFYCLLLMKMIRPLYIYLYI